MSFLKKISSLFSPVKKNRNKKISNEQKKSNKKNKKKLEDYNYTMF